MPLLTFPSITLSSFASTADQLAAISSETLELVRAVVPARYETQIRDIPALAVQYANDCAWLAERVRVVLEQAASEGVAVDGLARQVDKLMALSTIVLDRQVVSLLAKRRTRLTCAGIANARHRGYSGKPRGARDDVGRCQVSAVYTRV